MTDTPKTTLASRLSAVKTYRVATFCSREGGRKPQFSAYTLWYNPEWSGCVMIEVQATSGAEAKRKAIAERRKMEADRGASEA